MANFKRGRPKSSRAGCLCCSPRKHQRLNGSVRSNPIAVQRVLQPDLDEAFASRSGMPVGRSQKLQDRLILETGLAPGESIDLPDIDELEARLAEQDDYLQYQESGKVEEADRAVGDGQRSKLAKALGAVHATRSSSGH